MFQESYNIPREHTPGNPLRPYATMKGFFGKGVGVCFKGVLKQPYQCAMLNLVWKKHLDVPGS